MTAPIDIKTALARKRRESCFADGKFIPRLAAERLAADTPVAQFGGHLFTYSEGCYRPNGEKTLAKALTDILGDDWRLRHQTEALAYLRAASPPLDETPPLDEINVANGLLSVRDGLLGEHTPERRHCIQLPVIYDPDAECPRNDAFLVETLPDEATRATLFEVIGLLLVPDTSYQKAFKLLGPDGTGKSTELNVVTALLGEQNIAARPLHKLEQDRFATADLYGKLANICADLPVQEIETTSNFLQLVGRDRVSAEHKNQPAFQFRPFARFVFSANEASPTPGATSAYFRRWEIIPFNHRPRKIDEHLEEKLTTPEELSGLLNHALAGLARLRQNRGFTGSAEIDRAGQEFRLDVDTVAAFVADCCIPNPQARHPKAKIYGRYDQWCRDSGRGRLSRTKFYRRLAAAAHPAVLTETASRGVDFLAGLELREPEWARGWSQ